MVEHVLSFLKLSLLVLMLFMVKLMDGRLFVKEMHFIIFVSSKEECLMGINILMILYVV
jgi:hypothetical protein